MCVCVFIYVYVYVYVCVCVLCARVYCVLFVACYVCGCTSSMFANVHISEEEGSESVDCADCSYYFAVPHTCDAALRQPRVENQRPRDKDIHSKLTLFKIVPVYILFFRYICYIILNV